MSDRVGYGSQLFDRRLNPFQHVVERLRQPGDFVGTGGFRQSLVESLAADSCHGLRNSLHPPQSPSRAEVRDQEPKKDCSRPPPQEAVRECVQDMPGAALRKPQINRTPSLMHLQNNSKSRVPSFHSYRLRNPYLQNAPS